MELTVDQILQQGVAAHNAGDLQEAERLYRAILQVQPKHPDANHNLGLIAVSMNQSGMALPLFKSAIDVNPNIEQFWLSYIEALITERQFKNAKQALKKGKKKGVSKEKLKALTQKLVSVKAGNTPIQAPSQAEMQKLINHYQNGQYGDTETLAISITEQFPRHEFGWKVLGAVLSQTGRVSESLVAYQKSVELAPQDAEARSNLGITLKELGRLEEAEASYRQAITLKPDFAAAHYNMGITLKELGRLEEAEASYRQAISVKPDYAEAHNNLGITLNELGRLEESEASYRQAITLKPDYAEAHYNLGNTLKELGRLEEAEASYRQAISVKPDYAEAHSNLGATLKELGRLDEAISSFTQASFIDPKNPELYVLRGLTPSLIARQPLINRDDLIKSINDGDWASSETFLKQIFEENPSHIAQHVAEFINLWCVLCRDLINQVAIKRLIPIFIKLFVMGERNKDLNNLIQLFFENFDIDKVLELVEPKDKILINVSYCQYNFLKENFLQAEAIAIENIQKAESLIKVTETEDLGWLVVRRSLALCTGKAVPKTTLANLISNLVN